jgi:hypothetical protein
LSKVISPLPLGERVRVRGKKRGRGSLVFSHIPKRFFTKLLPISPFVKGGWGDLKAIF